MEKQDAEKEVTGQINTVDMEEEKKDMEKVVLKVNYETEDEKKEIEAASPKLETKDTEAGAGGHICSPSIESCPSPVSEEKEAEDAESGSSMSTLSLPSRSSSYAHHHICHHMVIITWSVTNGHHSFQHHILVVSLAH